MKREIIIDGEYSDWFEKATFILKESKEEQMPLDLMSYAEEIVEKHMKKAADGDINLVSEANEAYQKQQKYKMDSAPGGAKRLQETVKKAEQKSKNISRSLEDINRLKEEYEKLRKLQDKIRKREKYVNRFVVLSLLACILSLAALIFTSTM